MNKSTRGEAVQDYLEAQAEAAEKAAQESQSPMWRSINATIADELRKSLTVQEAIKRLRDRLPSSKAKDNEPSCFGNIRNAIRALKAKEQITLL